MQRWSIYIYFSPGLLGNYHGSQLQSELEEIRRVKPKFELNDQQIDAFRMLDIAILSCGLLLKMIIEEKF